MNEDVTPSEDLPDKSADKAESNAPKNDVSCLENSSLDTNLDSESVKDCDKAVKDCDKSFKDYDKTVKDCYQTNEATNPTEEGVTPTDKEGVTPTDNCSLDLDYDPKHFELSNDKTETRSIDETETSSLTSVTSFDTSTGGSVTGRLSGLRGRLSGVYNYWNPAKPAEPPSIVSPDSAPIPRTPEDGGSIAESDGK